MDRLTRDDLDTLLAAESDCCLSLFMPTHRTGGPELREDAIRFSNLVREADERLREQGCKGLALQQVQRSLEDLRNDEMFWRHQADGLAVFIAGEQRQTVRLPLKFEARCVVGPRFDITPLLPLLQGDGRFYVLAASQNHVRLLQGNRSEMHDIGADALPKSLRDALNIDEYQTHIQHHSMIGADIGGGPRGQAIYHGHGGGDMSVKKSDELLQFFRRIDNGLKEIFGVERVPLVFAGVEYLFPIFKEATGYRELVEEPVTGNPDQMSPQELHRKAWPLVESRFQKDRDAELDRMAAAASPSSTNPAEILAAARTGRVETLFLLEGGQWFGRFADESGELTTTEVGDGENLLNLVAIQTLQNGGRVFTVPAERIPGGGLTAARFRYAMEPAK